jgi:hypothetical protein
MDAKYLNGSQVGSGTGLEFTAPGVTATHDGSKTTFDVTPVINVATVTLTNAEIKALRATPKTLVAAPGAGKVLEFLSASLKLVAGANVLTESTANLAVRYTNTTGAIVSQAIETTGFIDQAANTVTSGLPKIDAIVAYSAAANQALVLHNTGAGEYAGNAAADATMTIKVAYRVHTI